MPDNEKVGYKNPPKSSQFKKGQSGNPNGRPKKKKSRSTDLQSAVLDMLDSPVTVTVDGATKQVPVAQAMVTQLRNDILTGTSVERVRAIKTLREICPGYNVPEEFEDAPNKVIVKLVDPDGLDRDLNLSEKESQLVREIIEGLRWDEIDRHDLMCVVRNNPFYDT